MQLDQIVMYVVLGIIALVIVGFLVIQIIKFAKMSKEDKIKYLKTYLKGLVALAEREIVGTKRGEERLQMVEKYFNEKAPMAYKIVLMLLGKDSLKQLIEEGLTEIKESFGE